MGTDAPGVIINIYILIIILRHFFDRKSEEFENVFLLIFLLCQFVLIIKITNSLIFLLLIILLFKIKIKKINFLLFSLICLIPFPWIFQNYIISKCLIWPISFLCFSNTDLALNETYLIESFAKGDITTTMDLAGFSWIKVWLSNHSAKIIEIYGLYIFVLLIPLIYSIFMKKFNGSEFFRYINLKYLNLNYLIILITVLISNCIWFFFTPAYRFGIFYNLSLIILIILPLWLYVIENNFKFLLNYSKFILVIICTYFIFENLRKIDWYIERYDIWPPIYQGNLLDRKNF